MSNKTEPNGFALSPDSPYKISAERMVAANETFCEGDVVYLDSDGNITFTSGGPTAGVAAGPIMDVTTKLKKATSAATAIDTVKIWTIECDFIAQITSGALTDPYTHFTTTSRFDVAGTTGVQYINASAHSRDEVICMGLATEEAGEISQFGAYQKVVCKFSGAEGAILRSNVTSKRKV